MPMLVQAAVRCCPRLGPGNDGTAVAGKARTKPGIGSPSKLLGLPHSLPAACPEGRGNDRFEEKPVEEIRY